LSSQAPVRQDLGHFLGYGDYETGNQLWHSGKQESVVPFVFFRPDSRSAFSLAITGAPVQWQIGEPTLDDLLAWIQANRCVRDLTCDERAQYRIEPLCK
jgi:hypothetical protein